MATLQSVETTEYQASLRLEALTLAARREDSPCRRILAAGKNAKILLDFDPDSQQLMRATIFDNKELRGLVIVPSDSKEFLPENAARLLGIFESAGANIQMDNLAEQIRAASVEQVSMTQADLSSIVVDYKKFVDGDRKRPADLASVDQFYDKLADQIRRIPSTILSLALPHIEKLKVYKFLEAALFALGDERASCCRARILKPHSQWFFYVLGGVSGLTASDFSAIVEAACSADRPPPAKNLVGILKTGRDLFAQDNLPETGRALIAQANNTLFAFLINNGHGKYFFHKYDESDWESSWTEYLGWNFRGLNHESLDLFAAELGRIWKDVDPKILPSLGAFIPEVRDELLSRAVDVGAGAWAAHALGNISYSIKRGECAPVAPELTLKIARSGQAQEMMNTVTYLALGPDKQREFLPLIPPDKKIELYTLSSFDRTVLEELRNSNPRIAFYLDTGSTDDKLCGIYVARGLERLAGDKAKVALALIRAGQRKAVANYLGATSSLEGKPREPLHGRTWRAVALLFSRETCGGETEGFLYDRKYLQFLQRIDLSLRDWRMITQSQLRPKVVHHYFLEALDLVPKDVLGQLEEKSHVKAFIQLGGKPDAFLYRKYLEHTLWQESCPGRVYERLIKVGMAREVVHALEIDRYSKKPHLDLSPAEWGRIPLLLIRAGEPEILNKLGLFTLSDEQLRELALASLCWPRQNVLPNESRTYDLEERNFREPFFGNLRHFPRSVLESVEDETRVCSFSDIAKLNDWELYNEYMLSVAPNVAPSTATTREFYRSLAASAPTLLERCCRTHAELPGELILELLNVGSDYPLRHLEKGNLDRRQWREAMALLIKRGEIDFIINAGKAVIPSFALEPYESDWHFLEYREKLGLTSAPIYYEYLDRRKKSGDLKAAEFCTEIRNLLDQVLKPGLTPRAVLDSPYYRDLIEHAYPAHAGGWSRFEAAHRAPERSHDLAKFKLRERYVLDLSEGVRMVLKEDDSPNEAGYEELLAHVSEVSEPFNRARPDSARISEILAEMIAEHYGDKSPELREPEERLMFLILEEAVRGNFSPQLKKLLFAYYVATTPHIEEYMQGTRDRSLHAKNPRYAQLVTLHEFFADTLKEKLSEIYRKAEATGRLESLLPRFYSDLAANRQEARLNDSVARSRADSLGITPVLLERLAQVARNTSGEKRRTALASIISGQQRQISRFIKDATGQEVNQNEIHLAYFSATNVLPKGAQVKEEALTPRQLENFFQGTSAKIFAQELAFLKDEIGKYRPDSSLERKALRLMGYFLKNKASAHARGTAGVCVAADNPKEPDDDSSSCQWNQENYFQFVIVDPALTRCEGAVLLHQYTDHGKSILTISVNPTSSLLYRVEERELFDSLLKQLIIFAEDNEIDMIASSTNEQIRTNRTATDFEKRWDELIKKTGEKFVLAEPQVFSVNPSYKQQELDVLWQRKSG